MTSGHHLPADATYSLLQIDGGICAFSDVKPAVVMLSSAAVERNAIIGDDTEARKRDIPIVQLNPGSTLNWKYEGENALRAAGLPYSIIRATGELGWSSSGLRVPSVLSWVQARLQTCQASWTALQHPSSHQRAEVASVAPESASSSI